jgi:hypothetical protein
MKQNKVIIFILCVFLLVVLGILAYSFQNNRKVQSNQNSSKNIIWQKFEASDANFTASFPTIPKRVTYTKPINNSKTNGHTTVIQYASQSTDGHFFAVSLFKYPENYSITDSNAFLGGMVNYFLSQSFSSSAKYILLSSKIGKYYGYNGEKFQAKNTANTFPLYMNDILVVVGNSAYLIEQDDNDNNLTFFNKFINSIAISK